MEKTIKVVGNQNCRIRYKGVAYEFEEGKTTVIPEEMLESLKERHDRPVRFSEPSRIEDKKTKKKEGEK